MSVDLSLILPNNCTDIRNNKLSMEVFDEAIERVVSHFGGRKQFVTDITMCNSDSEDWRELWINPESAIPEYSFSVPLLSATFYMHQGYWDVWPNARYYHYFYPIGHDQNGNPILWARYDCFNAAKALGFTEGWVCDEFHSHNCELSDEPASFETWLSYGDNEEDARVFEYSVGMFGDNQNVNIEYECKYHDTFKECHALVKTFEERFPKYRILTLGRPHYRFALVTKGEELFVVSIATGESLTDFPIDNCNAEYNGAGFTISKDKLKAFFNSKGERLTDFRVGDFKWKWRTSLEYPLDQVVTDLATGKQFLIKNRY